MLINKSIKNIFDKKIGIGILTVPIQPTYFWYDFGYFGNIYTSTELAVASPVFITGIRYNIRNNTPNSFSCNNQTIKLGYCNQPVFLSNVNNNFEQIPLGNPPNNFISTNITIVISSFTWTIINTAQAWYEIIFNVPFQYNPNLGNLLVIWEGRDGTFINGTSANPTSVSSSNGTPNSYSFFADGSMPNPLDTGTSSSSGRPNVELILKI